MRIIEAFFNLTTIGTLGVWALMYLKKRDYDQAAAQCPQLQSSPTRNVACPAMDQAMARWHWFV